MNTLFKEAINAVEEINEKMFDQAEEGSSCQYILLEMKTTGDIIIIEFCGIQIWNSEEDEREFHDSTNILPPQPGSYEPIRTYLNRQINELVKYISKISL
jgi:hypothetical protein